MNKLIISSIVFILFSCEEKKVNHFVTFDDTQNIDYLPTSTTGAVYKHNSYVFSYSEKHEQSEWVAYCLNKSDIKYTKYKRPYFEQDPIVKTKSADWRNYKNSGYNKGHLCPAADRKISYTTYKETFYTSNVTPQLYVFNAGIWNRLEEKTRYWAEKHNGIYIITGGILSENLKTIGKEDVSVPKYFYKVIATKDGSKMIGFLVPHKDSKKPLYKFVVPIDEIEKITKIDFFPKLNDNLEKKLEANKDYKNWSF